MWITIAPYDRQLCTTTQTCLSCGAILSHDVITYCFTSAMGKNVSFLHMTNFTPHDKFTMYTVMSWFTLFWRKIQFVTRKSQHLEVNPKTPCVGSENLKVCLQCNYWNIPGWAKPGNEAISISAKTVQMWKCDKMWKQSSIWWLGPGTVNILGLGFPIQFSNSVFILACFFSEMLNAHAFTHWTPVSR